MPSGQYLVMNTEEIERHLPFVKKIVNQINLQPSSLLDKDDLLSVGMLGLMDAYKRYNPTKNASFETYARMRITGTIMDELRKTGIISRKRNDKIKTYYRACDALQQSLQRMPTDDEICHYLQISQSQLHDIHETLQLMSILSLEELLYEKQDTSNLTAPPQESALSRIERMEQFDSLTHAIKLLDEKEQQVLQLHYVEGLNFNEIGEVFNVTKSRISQIHRQALHTLRFYIRK